MLNFMELENSLHQNTYYAHCEGMAQGRNLLACSYGNADLLEQQDTHLCNIVTQGPGEAAHTFMSK